MKRFTVIILLSLISSSAYSVTFCEFNRIYTSCNQGFYLSDTKCKVCPDDTYKDTAGAQTSCTSCPALDGITGHARGDASILHSSIMNCFFPADTDVNETIGLYHFDDSCYYN